MSTARRLRRLAGTTAAVMGACVMSACGGGGAAAGGDEVVLHAVSSQTGPGAPYGNFMTQGAELALEQVNADGGIGGKQVTLETEDDGTDAARGVTILQRVAPESDFVLAYTISSVFAQVAPVANDLEVPIIGPAVSASNLVIENRPWTFSTFPNLRVAVPRAVAVWGREQRIERAAMILDNQNEATVSQAALYEKALVTNDVELTDKVAVATGDVNFGAAVERALRTDPDGVVVSALPEQAGAIVRALRSASSDVSIFIPTAGFVPQVITEVAGEEAIDGVYTVQAFFGGEGASATSREFLQDFHRKFDTEPEGTAAFGYEAILILRQAAADGAYVPGDPSQENRERLRRYLETLDWEGPFGRIVMGDDGIIQRDFYVLEAGPGGELRLEETLAPRGTD
jgi:branched-chain amino acid transport system substrate-binding protein